MGSTGIATPGAAACAAAAAFACAASSLAVAKQILCSEDACVSSLMEMRELCIALKIDSAMLEAKPGLRVTPKPRKERCSEEGQ